MEKKLLQHDCDELFEKQIAMLRTFLAHGAITETQYRHSAGELARKMGKTLTDSRLAAAPER